MTSDATTFTDADAAALYDELTRLTDGRKPARADAERGAAADRRVARYCVQRRAGRRTGRQARGR